MAEPPVVSVVIACRDAAETLAVQLRALATQDCPWTWEVLLCDNGSRDESLALARRHAGSLPGLRVVDASQRPGPAHARNVGVAAARGRWIVFCDADDEVAPGWLVAMGRALQDHPFVAGRFEGHRLNRGRVARSRPVDQQHGLQASEIGPGLLHAGAGNMGVHRDAFLGVGGFDETLVTLEDTDLSWRLQLAGAELHFAADAVVHVRLRTSLLAMYRQGHGYGVAYAELERRYGRPGRHTSAAGGAHRRWRLDPGRTVWQVGWHVGYRADSQPRVRSAPGPAATQADSQPAPRATGSGPGSDAVVTHRPQPHPRKMV